MAAGMAKEGWKPVVSIYSTFLQRSFDQLIHDVALQSLPVTICIDRAGLVGDDGKTHQGVFDIAYTRCIPNMTVAAPKDENELQHLLFTAIESGRPVGDPVSARSRARRPARRDAARDPDRPRRDPPRGQGRLLPRVRLDGPRRGRGGDAARARSGIDCGVVNARFAKPLDGDLLAARFADGPARPDGRGAPRGGRLRERRPRGASRSAGSTRPASEIHAIPDQFIEHSPQALQRRNFRLDAEGLVARVLEL